MRNMKKKKDPTPEPSSFEEDNVDTEFEVGSEEETSDDEFTPTKGRNAQRQEARKREITQFSYRPNFFQLKERYLAEFILGVYLDYFQYRVLEIK